MNLWEVGFIIILKLSKSRGGEFTNKNLGEKKNELKVG